MELRQLRNERETLVRRLIIGLRGENPPHPRHCHCLSADAYSVGLSLPCSRLTTWMVAVTLNTTEGRSQQQTGTLKSKVRTEPIHVPNFVSHHSLHELNERELILDEQDAVSDSNGKTAT